MKTYGHQRKNPAVDLDAFFCAVEEQLNPELKGKAFAVGGEPGHRSVVSSCSYPARKLGFILQCR
jgi:DNA polymerase-4